MSAVNGVRVPITHDPPTLRKCHSCFRAKNYLQLPAVRSNKSAVLFAVNVASLDCGSIADANIGFDDSRRRFYESLECATARQHNVAEADCCRPLDDTARVHRWHIYIYIYIYTLLPSGGPFRCKSCFILLPSVAVGLQLQMQHSKRTQPCRTAVQTTR